MNYSNGNVMRHLMSIDDIERTVQTKINLYEIACKWHARGLQLACERLAENEAGEARQAFKRLVSCLQKASKWLAEAH